MNTPTQPVTDISAILNFTSLTEIEQTQVIEQIGDLVLESAILRLVTELSPSQNEALEQFLETEPKAEVLLSHLLTHHENFAQFIDEEGVVFRADAATVFAEHPID